MRSSGNRKKRARAASARGTLLRAALVVLSALVLVVCWRLGTRPQYESMNLSPETPADIDQAVGYLALTEVDRDTSAEGAKTIDLTEADGEVLVTSDQPVRLTGRLNGTVRVRAPEQTVHLLLDGAEITSVSGSAILVEEADRVIITLTEGSRNLISDSGAYPAGSDCDGCIYSDCDLTFNGTGSLEVNGLYQDGIRSTDRVKIVDGSYRIEAKRNAIRGNDGIRVAGGTLFLGSEKNGMKTTKQGAEGRGDLVISGGDVSVVAGRYAFVVEKAQLYFLDCRVTTSAVVGDFDVHGMRYIEDGCMP